MAEKNYVMKPSDRIYEIAMQDRLSMDQRQFQANLLPAIIQYLDELHARQEEK